MGEVPKEQYMDWLRDFDTLKIGMLKGVFPCTSVSMTMISTIGNINKDKNYKITISYMNHTLEPFPRFIES
jgi:hypothetical protein